MLAAHSKLTAGHEEFDQKGFAKVTFQLLHLQYPGPTCITTRFSSCRIRSSFTLGRGMHDDTKKRVDQMVANRFGEDGKKSRGREYLILQRTVACKESSV